MDFIKKNWAYFLAGFIVLIFLIQITFYYATFKNLDFGWNLFPHLADKSWFIEGKEIDDGLEGKWGAFGDFIGGILNPILGFITIILLLVAHNKDSKRDEKYHQQRATDLFLLRIDKLKAIHLDNVKNIHLIKYHEGNNEPSYIHQGTFFFTIFLQSLEMVIKNFKKNKNISQLQSHEILEVSIALLFKGNNRHFRMYLENNYPTLSYVSDISPIILRMNPRINKTFGVNMFIGLRTQTSTYFRNLYHLIDTIDSSNVSEKLKYELVKDVRVMLSSQEQVLLCLNSFTSFGKKWNLRNLIIKYRLCRNIGDLKIFAETIDMEIAIKNLIDNCNSIDNKDEYKTRYFE